MRTDMYKRLTCTDEQFDALHRALAKARSTGKTVAVDKAALTELLLDHQRLLKEVE
jgi:hypothetical protein